MFLYLSVLHFVLLENLHVVTEYGTDRVAIPSRVEHVLSRGICRGRTRPVHAVDGILHARRLWPRARS